MESMDAAFADFLASERAEKLDTLFTPTALIAEALKQARGKNQQQVHLQRTRENDRGTATPRSTSLASSAAEPHRSVLETAGTILTEGPTVSRAKSSRPPSHLAGARGVENTSAIPPTPMMPQRDSKIVSQQHGFLFETDLNALMHHTGYRRRELFELFTRFKSLVALSTHGEGIDRETFRRGWISLALEDQGFVDRVFSLLDSDGSGIIEFPEFLTAAYLLEKGSREARAEFLFRVYDEDGSNSLERDELYQYFISSLRIPGDPDELTSDVLRSFANEVFEDLEGKSSAAGASLHISREDIYRYIHSHLDADVPSIFGRSMLVGPDADIHTVMRRGTAARVDGGCDGRDSRGGDVVAASPATRSRELG